MRSLLSLQYHVLHKDVMFLLNRFLKLTTIPHGTVILFENAIYYIHIYMLLYCRECNVAIGIARVCRYFL